MIEDAQDLRVLYEAYRERYRDRDERVELIQKVVRGDFSVFDPEGDDIDSRSPNLVQVALEDTAEAASGLPTIRITPHKAGEKAKGLAARQERIGTGYFDVSKMDLLVPQTVLDLAATGFACWVVWPDFEHRLPVIEHRRSAECYPEPGLRPGDDCRKAMFIRRVHYSQLPDHYRVLLFDFVTDDTGRWINERLDIDLVEWFDEDEIVIAAMMTHNPIYAGTTVSVTPVILERITNETGVCPVVIGSRITLDKEFRGQFDQVVGVLEAHIRLLGMVIDYADQAVYSDIWVKDPIGQISWGGGAYIELGPQGGIGRVPPAVTSLNIQQDIERLVDAIHLGGRWPKSRPGEIDQSIASAKFLESAAGMLNTVLKTYHIILKRMMERALRVAYTTDQKVFPGEKVISGVLNNQEFVQEYDASKDIDLRNPVRIEYGLGLGRDPSQSAVLMIQYAQSGFISDEFVQENIDGVVDVERERVRIDTAQLRAMMFAKLLEGVQTGTVPSTALVDIHDAREKGEAIAALYRKFIAEPEAAQPFNPLGGALGAGPGAPPAPGAGPGAPPGVAMPPVPPAPGGVEMLARLGVPIDGGGTLGTQVMGGPGG